MTNNKLRIFFISDIHGSEVCFKKFINSVDVYKSDVIILGGDITGKFIVPIYDYGNYYKLRIDKEEQLITNREELERSIQKIKDSGSYPYITTKEVWGNLVQDRDKMDEIFNELVIESVRGWINYAEKKLNGKNVKCYIMPGNDDSYAIDRILSSSDIIINPNEKIVQLSDKLEMLSLGYSNITPWKCPRDISEEELESKIIKLMSNISAGVDVIFNIHVPPYDSGIDSAPELNENMRPKVGPGGQLVLIPVGSRAVRKCIETFRPLLGLHGHVHEARGFSRINKTLCFNPGSEYHEGILRGVLIQIDKNKVKDYIFTSG
ncbi:MAG: metallophosphoesterase [Nitrososphaerota archaeon]